jgi:hypothetical protein
MSREKRHRIFPEAGTSSIMLDVLLSTDHNFAEYTQDCQVRAMAGVLRFHTILFQAKLMAVSR